MDDIANSAKMMPFWLLLPAIVLSAILIGWACSQFRSNSARFVMLTIWTRYACCLFFVYTFASSPLGMSWIGLLAAGLVAAGLLIVPGRLLTLKSLLPYYLLLLVATLSAIGSLRFGGLFSVVIKYFLLILMALGLLNALRTMGDRFMSWLTLAFVPLFPMQALSILLGIYKATEGDGSRSYIGGYNHEGVFSVALLTPIAIASLARTMNPFLRAFVLTAGLYGLFMANYRTSIIASLPMLGMAALLGAMAMVPRGARPWLLATMLVSAPLGLLAAGGDMGRFAELSAVTKIGDYFTRPPDEFNREDRAVMSGRPFLWAKYIYAWRTAGAEQQLFGAGPEARIQTNYQAEKGVVVSKYPHNTFVSTLYEYGVAGLLAMLLLLFTPIVLAFRIRGPDRMRVLAAHVGMLMLAFGTMPLWQFEGIILYGIIWGYTLYAVERSRFEARRPSTWYPVVSPQYPWDPTRIAVR